MWHHLSLAGRILYALVFTVGAGVFGFLSYLGLTPSDANEGDKTGDEAATTLVAAPTVANFLPATRSDRVIAEIAVDGGSRRRLLATELQIHSQSGPLACTVTGGYEEEPASIARYRVEEGPAMPGGSTTRLRIEEVGGTLQGSELHGTQRYKPQGCVTGGSFCISLPVSVQVGQRVGTVIVEAPLSEPWQDMVEHYQQSRADITYIPDNRVGASVTFSDGTQATWGEGQCQR